jgi:hypothetical protein
MEKKVMIEKEKEFDASIEDIVNALNKHQKNPHFHPYTCGKKRTDENHLDGEGVLVATEKGWKCPYCDYEQRFGIFEIKLAQIIITGEMVPIF